MFEVLKSSSHLNYGNTKWYLEWWPLSKRMKVFKTKPGRICRELPAKSRKNVFSKLKAIFYTNILITNRTSIFLSMSRNHVRLHPFYVMWHFKKHFLLLNKSVRMELQSFQYSQVVFFWLIFLLTKLCMWVFVNILLSTEINIKIRKYQLLKK